MPVDAAPSTSAPTKLARRITGPLLFLFILGDVLGAGVYALMGELSAETGGVLWAPLLVALLLALLTAGSYAELVTKYPRAGGAAVFAERAFGKPVISFLVGFSMLAAGVTSAAGLALAFSGDYLATFIDVPTTVAALVFLALVACLNARGISESLKTNVVMTAIELSGLILVVAVVAVMMGRGDGDVGRVTEFPDGTAPGLAILAGAILAYYSFVGFETSANVVEEIKDPRRVYPSALFGALITAGVVYALVGLASAIALPTEELSQSSGPLLDVVAASGVGVPDWLFSLVALIAVANGALLTMIMSSRLTFGMSEQGLLPGVFARVLPKRRTPWVAILATTAVAMVLTLVGDLSMLAETVVLLLLFVFLSANVSVLVLRRDRVDHDHFQVWTFVPVLGIASCVLLLTQQSAQVWLLAGALLAVGVVLYLLARRFGPETAETAEDTEDSVGANTSE
ncbi:APC family permease [Mycolicibacterium parafortuitum]|uniref:Amino acid transporters [Microbacterium testaceum StLB037] n=1 Tax=Mycolicibacterium parafortuitum TaxID=39692 RepID=A0A375YIH7_MYCPF|nr:APC family permease [Mycolicibacterium parafortuitum]ORB32252.1 amino acid permease [Mycolicibacterium parafortuitum]SRX80932.1 amino acid transporters [Microbacterium testaceum StLB037] [Mycolicibacterium parafortuitum]